MRKIVLGLLVLLVGLGFWQWPNVLKSVVKEKWSGPQHQLAIVSLTTAPENLWDPETGIYVKGNHDNYFQEGKNWERLADLKFYEPDGQLGFATKVGLRIHGNTMRPMPQKPLRLYFKNSEGQDEILKYPVFGEKGSQWFSSLVLRVGDSERTMIRDALAQELVEANSGLDVQRARPVVVYLNQQYWGLYFLQERFDEEYFYEKYQLNPKSVTVLEVPLGEDYNQRGQAVAESRADQKEADKYNRLLAAERHSIGSLGYEWLDKEADAANLLDYLLFELYFDNQDWPFNNIKIWRYQTEPLAGAAADKVGALDGRWRWLLFDVDVGFGPGSIVANPYERLIDEAFPFRNLFYEPEFQWRYLKRLKELITDGLSPEKAVLVVDRLAEEIRPEMARQIERWGSEPAEDGRHGVSSLGEWEKEVAILKEFVSQRPAYFLEQTQKLFD